MKYVGPHIGFHPSYFCLGYLIVCSGKNIKNVSEQIALTGTPPTPTPVNITLKLKTHTVAFYATIALDQNVIMSRIVHVLWRNTCGGVN